MLRQKAMIKFSQNIEIRAFYKHLANVFDTSFEHQ